MLPEPEWNVFLATPMAGLSDADYDEHRQICLQVVQGLESRDHLKVFYAGRTVPKLSASDAADEALMQDFSALERSRVLLMTYPAKVVSSTLIELGAALAWRKPCFVLAKDGADLPYLLRQAEEVALLGKAGPFRVVRWRNGEQLLAAVDSLRPDILRLAT